MGTGCAGVRKTARTLNEIQLVVISPMLDFSLTNEVERADKFHSLIVCAVELRHHRLNLTAVEHTHKNSFYNIVIVMTECDFVTAELLCLFVEITSPHSCAKVAGIFVNIVNRIKNICFKNGYRNVQPTGIALDYITIFNAVARSITRKTSSNGNLLCLFNS